MTSNRHHRAVGVWFFGCAFLVLSMVVVGGLTRLTRAGLSITEWKPITGILPPLGEAAWLDAFQRYQASPEFRLVNHQMDMSAFQRIFLIEYGHRLLGRIAGFVFFLPMLWFIKQKMLDRSKILFTSALLILGGIQGAAGWFMVKSGLIDIPRVSPYRLTIHLMLALFLLTLLAWGGARELRQERSYHAGLSWWISMGALGITATWGALMAGLHAGHLFSTFPKMAGFWVPPGMATLSPIWINLTENSVLVHFLHRILAISTATIVFYSWWSWRHRYAGTLATVLWRAIPILLGTQVFLGIATVMTYVPLPLASLHQTCGALLIGVVAAFGALLTRPEIPSDNL